MQQASTGKRDRTLYGIPLILVTVALVVAALVYAQQALEIEGPRSRAIVAANNIDREIARANEALSRLREALLVDSPGQAVADFDPVIQAVRCRRGEEEIFAASVTPTSAVELEGRSLPQSGDVTVVAAQQVIIAGGSFDIRSYALLDLSEALASTEGLVPRLVTESLPQEVEQQARRDGWVAHGEESAPEFVAATSWGLFVAVQAPPTGPSSSTRLLLWVMAGIALVVVPLLGAKLLVRPVRGPKSGQERLVGAAVELIRASAVSSQIDQLLRALERALNEGDNVRWRLVAAEAIEKGDVDDVDVSVDDLRLALERATRASNKDSAVTKAVRAPETDGDGRTLFVVRDVGAVYGVAIAEGDLTGGRLSRGAELLLRITAASLRTATLLERLVASEQHAAVGRLAAGVAHEVNNPLAYVVMNLRSLERTVEGDRLDAVREALEGAQRIELVIRGLRVLFRGSEELVFRRVDMLELLTKTRRIASARRVGTPIEVEAESALWVEGDEVGLGQVALNLMTNAVDAVSECAEPKVTVRLYRKASQIIVDVIDNGPGVPAALQGRLFEAFVSDKGKKGTGLGLGIARSFARAHGGEVSLYSTKFGETIFRFAMPESRARPSAPPPPQPEPIERLHHGAYPRPKVLLIDDEAQLIRAMKRWLDEVAEITGTTSALEALELVEEQRFSLILCDLNMPKMSGVEFVDALRERDRELSGRVVIMTGSVEANLPDIRVITKPVSPDTVRDLLEESSQIIDQSSATS